MTEYTADISSSASSRTFLLTPTAEAVSAGVYFQFLLDGEPVVSTRGEVVAPQKFTSTDELKATKYTFDLAKVPVGTTHVVKLLVGPLADGATNLAEADCNVYSFTINRVVGIDELVVQDSDGNAATLTPAFHVQENNFAAEVSGTKIKIKTTWVNPVKVYIGNSTEPANSGTSNFAWTEVDLADYTAEGSDTAIIPIRAEYTSGDITSSRSLQLSVKWTYSEDKCVPVVKEFASTTVICQKGEEAKLQAEIETLEVKGEVSYQWYQIPSGKQPVAENNVKITDATNALYVPSTNKSGTYWYCCEIINSMPGGQTYSAYSGYVKVVVRADAPIITRQPGTFTLVNKIEVAEGTYRTVYKAGEQCDPIHIGTGAKDNSLERSYTWFYNTVNSTSNGTKLDTTFYRGTHQSGKSGYYNYSFKVNETFATGTYYLYCVIRDTDQNNPENYAEITSETCRIVFESLSDTDFEGSGTETDPYQLKTQEDLMRLQTRVNEEGISYAGVYFKIVNDMVLPSGWTPIGCTKNGSIDTQGGLNLNAFAGTIDGKISDDRNAKITVPVDGKPLFGYVNGATIRNLDIYGERIAGAGLVDSLNGYNLTGNGVTIEYVHILGGTQTLKSGLVNSVYSTNSYACSSYNFTVTIRNCTIDDDVVIGYDGKESRIGSFANRINGTIENCSSSATVQGKNYVGGILGTQDNAMGKCEVKNCTFDGTVNASGSYIGGIVGGGYSNDNSAPNARRPSVMGCTVTGIVSGKECVGGIVGGDQYVAQTWDNVTHSVTGNTFTGTIKGSKYVGGIIGYYNSLNKFDNIAGNTYSGADRGIGYIKYIDTSYKNPTLMDGTIVFNTGETTRGLPEVEWNTWKANHNRTDDPLGADADKLCKKLGSSEPVKPTCYEIKVSGSYKTEYTVGEKLDLTGIKITAYWTDKTTTELTTKDVKVTGYDMDKTGNQTVTISYGELKAYITVTVKPKSTAITVTVSILGDSNHGETSKPHGLARGGLKSWYSGTVEANANETVWDVLKRVASANGISISADSSNSYGTVYIRSVKGLGEFDNGPNSGWMYTVNGTHPEVGVSAKYVKDGDKIVLHYTDDYSYEEGGRNYGKDPGSTADSTAKEVDALIEKIGTVSYTDACKQRIDAARKAYNNLSATDKAKVTKLSVLEAAEKKYSELKKADNQEKADTVIGLINKIDKNVTKDSKKAIEAARTAYDKLTAEQKALVTNYKKLTDAETALAELTASDKDEEKAREVMDLIDKLGKITLESEKDIEAARNAYDKLTGLQKLLVENYDVLEQAEAKLAALKGSSKIDDPYKSTGDYLENLGTPGVGSIGGEWMVIGLLRSDRKVDEAYYEAVVKYVQENIDENGRLHAAKSTENSRIILALTAMGKDVTKVGGYNLLTGLNDMDFVQKQGINGPIWALIALDSGNYPVPDGNVTREGLIQSILLAQTSDGGWAISGDEADSDMTGMALQALAPYYETNEEVKNAVDKALVTLSEMQDADGGFSTFSGNGKVATSESTAQVIVALTALGINPDTDARFIKNGHSAIDALLSYYVKGGGFKHIASGERDGMATEQGYYALTAFYRFLYGKTSLYNMTDVIDMGGVVDVTPKNPEESTEPDVPAVSEPDDVGKEAGSFPWVIMVLVLLIVFGGGVLTVAVIIPKVKKKTGRYE